MQLALIAYYEREKTLMASAQARPYLAGSPDIKLEYGVPQTFALKFTEGKSVESRFPGGRVMFTAIDERKLFLDDEDANDLERTLHGLGIGKGDFIRVTKIRHPRGGGHSIRVEAVDEREDPGTLAVSRVKPDPDPAARRPARMTAQPRTASREEVLLEKSVAMARESGPAAFAAATQTSAPLAVTAASSQMCAAMCAAVDSIIETQAYAQRRGLGVTFSEESVRAIGLTIFIQNVKGAR